MEEICKKLEDLLSVRADAVKKVAENIDRIKEEVCADKTKYATNFDWLGVFCPSLIIDKMAGGYKKGRLLSKQPKSTKYNKCYFNEKGEVLYFEKYNEYGCGSTYYFFKIDDVIWAVPFIRDGKNVYPTYVHAMIYENGKIKEYAYMEPTSINFEKYVYTNDTDKIVCYDYYYVRNEKRGTLRTSKVDIFMEQRKVKKLLCYEKVNGEDKLIYQYEK